MLLKHHQNSKQENFGEDYHKTQLKQLDGTFDEKLEKISGAKVMDIAQNMINSANNEQSKYDYRIAKHSFREF